MTTDRGSVRWHRNGWEIRVQVDGRRVTRRVRAPNDREGRRQAEDALDALVVALGAGAESITVGQMLAQYVEVRGPSWSPSTRAATPHLVAPLVAEWGGRELSTLTAREVERTYARWVAAGASPATVRRRHSVLGAACNLAERWGLVLRAPTRGVVVPEGLAAADPDLPELGQVFRAFGLLENVRLRVAAELAVATGARRGELLGLRWCDVVERGVVAFGGAVVVDGKSLVRKATKGGKPKRLAIDEGTSDVLDGWRVDRRARALALGVGRLDDVWPVLESPSDPRVPWHPDRVTRTWMRHRDAIGLGGLRFHDLRHLHATYLLGEGSTVHAVAARGGHGPAMVLSRYGHAIPAHDQAAADAIGRARKKS